MVHIKQNKPTKNISLTIHSGCRAILQNPTDYPDPILFNPDRFLKVEDGTLNPDVKDPMTAAFGFGRRICPGRVLAYTSIWLTVACILATFEISKDVDDDMSATGEYVSGMVT